MSRFIAILATIVLSASSLSAADYAVDNVHTNVLWKVSHLGTSMMYGRFNEIAGSLKYDGTTLGDVSITIVTNSIDSGTEKLDKHLKSGDFFDAGQYPTITFESTGIAPVDGGFDVTGNLTLLGVSKPVTVTMTKTGSIEHEKFGTRVGFHGVLNIKRSDFGMTYYVDNGAVGDPVELIISVEAIKQ